MNNLIGISGKIGSGKDLVGSIIQYLGADDSLAKSTPDIIADMEYNWYASRKISDYQIKKYADKLKDIVCLMIGCTRADLEDREFKEKPLGEEWAYYTVNSRKFSTLEELKAWVETYYHTVEMHNWGVKKYHTPRTLLQLMGTECGRQTLHPNIWINALFADYTCDEERL